MKYGHSNGVSRGRGKPSTPPGQINVSLAGATGEITVDTQAGIVTAQITAPARVAAIDEGHSNGPGWIERTLTELQGGPSLIALPLLSGDPLPGASIDFTRAAWLVGDTAANVSVTFDLEADSGAGFAPVPGYDDQEYGSVPSYPINQADRGTRFRLRERALGATTGADTATSAVFAIPAEDQAPLPQLVGAPINQDADLQAGAVETEAATGALPGAGRYLVGIVDLNQGGVADLTIEGGTIGSVIALGNTTGTGNTHVRLYLADASGAGDVVVRNTSGVISYARQILIYSADGLTDENLLFASATGATDADPLSVTLGSATAGMAALAIGICRAGDSTAATWGGAMSNDDLVSEAAFSSAAHRATSAVSSVLGAPYTVTVAFDDTPGEEWFALAVVLLAAEAVVPEGAHPGFLKAAGEPGQTHPNGWGIGDHYTLETDATVPQRMVLEPGETTQRWYFQTEENGGLTAAQIEAAEGLQAGTVTASWLRSGTNVNLLARQYGLRSDKPVSSAAFLGSFSNELRNGVTGSPWYDCGPGVTIGEVHFPLGESPINPAVFGSLDPAIPVADLPRVTDTNNVGGDDRVAGNFVLTGIASRGQGRWRFNGVNGEENVIFADCHLSSNHDSVITSGSVPSKALTLFACTIYDCWRAMPEPEGASDWSNPNACRISGTFFGKTVSKLTWRTHYDTNGWEPGYNEDGITWNNGAFGQPPTFYNHNSYDSEENDDVTFAEILTSRAAFSAFQSRSGSYSNVIVCVDNNAGGNFFNGFYELVLPKPLAVPGFAEGETVVGQTSGASWVVGVVDDNTADVTLEMDDAVSSGIFAMGETVVGQTSGARAVIGSINKSGNYALASHVLTMSAGNKRNNDQVDESNPSSAKLEGVRSKAWNGLNAYQNVIDNMIVANLADPADAADIAQKSDIIDTTNTGLEPAEVALVHSFDLSLYNWGDAANNTGLDGLSSTALNEVTIGAFVDGLQGQPIGTETTDSALNHLRATYRNPGLLANDIWNHAATRFGRDTLGHAPGATALFTPNSKIDGYRSDSPLNWQIGGAHDLPIDGDSLGLNGNTMYSFMTFRFADLDFGAGGGLRLFGGLVSCDTSQGSGTVTLERAGKFRVGTGTHASAYDIAALGGRYEVDGTVTNVSGDFIGQSQCIVYGGGALTIAPGESLILTGDAVKAGFDGAGGAAATLTLQGTLTFVAGASGFSSIREVRTGRFGFADLGGGVTGQPVDPDVVSTVVLGGILNVNVSGLAPGTYTLINVDSLSGSFDSASVTGGTGSVSADPSAGRVTVTVS